MRSSRPPVRFDVLPILVSGQTRYNGTSYSQSVVTDGNDLYVAVWNSSRVPIIATRTLPFGTWATFDLSNVPDDSLALPAVDDSHGVISMIMDRDGYLYLAANMHGHPFRGVRSTNPRDISAWEPLVLTGLNEGAVTYPRWAIHPDGTIFFHFRDGTSGNGDTYLNRKPRGAAWEQVGMIAAGKATSENPYETRVVCDRKGVLHIGYTWRPQGGTFNQNADVHYIRSFDKGDAWETVDGTSVDLPLTHANSDALVLSTPASNSGIVNQFGLDVDTNGYPHMALTLATGSTPDRNVHHLWWDGDSWVTEQVTNVGNGFAYDDMPTRPVAICSDSGRTLIAYSLPRSGSNIGDFRMIDVTSPGSPGDVPIAELDGRSFELSIDERALREHDTFRTLLSAANEEVVSPGPEYNHLDNWQYQWAGVLSLDLSLIHALTQRNADLPRIEVVATLALEENLVIDSAQTTGTQFPGGVTFVTPRDLRGRQLFVQQIVRASIVSAGSGKALTIYLREVLQGEASYTYGRLEFTATSTALKSTPWIPCRQRASGTGSGLMIGQLAAMSGGVDGLISSSTVRIGVLAGPVAY